MNLQHHLFRFELDADELGRLFMPRASTFEVLQASVLQESFILDSVNVESSHGSCRMTYSEWEEDDAGGQKVWISEYAIELVLDSVIAYGTYSASFKPEQRESGALLERLKRDAEEDFMLCCKLLGRSVRRDLVVDDEPGGRGGSVH